jgi:septal ring factor EnvC (AmiA/AmiB activator)
MAKDDRSALRDEIQELQEEAAALTDRAKKTARLAEVLSERIKHLQTQMAKNPKQNGASRPQPKSRGSRESTTS